MSEPKQAVTTPAVGVAVFVAGLLLFIAAPRDPQGAQGGSLVLIILALAAMATGAALAVKGLMERRSTRR